MRRLGCGLIFWKPVSAHQTGIRGDAWPWVSTQEMLVIVVSLLSQGFLREQALCGKDTANGHICLF